jgi:hypothetical protein
MPDSIIKKTLWSYTKESAVISRLIAENVLKANYRKNIAENIWNQKQAIGGHNGAT